MTLTPPSSRSADVAIREQLVLDAQLIVSETIRRQEVSGVGLAANQRAYYMLAGFLAGDVVTGLACCCTTAGVAMTLAKLGVYSTTNAQLGVTADVDTSFETAGIKSVPLTAPLTITADGAYYLACLFVAGTTLPILLTGVTIATSAGLVNGAGVPAFAIESALADLPATATPTPTGANRSYWIAAF